MATSFTLLVNPLQLNLVGGLAHSDMQIDAAPIVASVSGKPVIFTAHVSPRPPSNFRIQ